MPADRPRRPRPGGRGANGPKRGGPNRRGRPDGSDRRSGGRPTGRPDGSGRRSGGRATGRPDGSGRRSGGPPKRSDGGPAGGGRRSDRRDDRGRPASDRRSAGPGRGGGEPRTEAERRAAEVRARRGPRRTPRTPEREREQIESRQVEEWVDEGSVRAEAEAATRRAGARRERSAREVDPDVIAEIRDAVEPRRAARLAERLTSASAALDRERFEEARRMVAPLVKELPHVAAVHEVSGLAAYRLGRWRAAAQSLELARQLRPDPSILPVLADCYRAMRRWKAVDELWAEVRSLSPSHEVMAEARIVTAGSLADRGDLRAAIELMTGAGKPPKRVREHHLRQWYVLADLYDRAGDPIAAQRWFREVAALEPDFADVRDRLRALGR